MFFGAHLNSDFLAIRTEFLRCWAFHMDYLSGYLGKLCKISVTPLIYMLESGALEQVSNSTAVAQ